MTSLNSIQVECLISDGSQKLSDSISKGFGDRGWYRVETTTDENDGQKEEKRRQVVRIYYTKKEDADLMFQYVWRYSWMDWADRSVFKKDLRVPWFRMRYTKKWVQ